MDQEILDDEKFIYPSNLCTSGTDYIKSNLVIDYTQNSCRNELCKKSLRANVSYYLNYSENDKRYHWIDDYDNEIIKYPPEDPVRNGYEFAGWYKEPECINKWDFKTDIVPEVKYNDSFTTEDGYVINTGRIYNETVLYAKWIEI